jgi:hypothetical protein
VLLAEANHDYGGLRHKAMEHTRKALHAIDEKLLKAGSPAAKALAAADEAAAKALKQGAEKDKTKHERQAASDQQLLLAHNVLAQVHQALAGEKHNKARGHIQDAIKEITTALKK